MTLNALAQQIHATAKEKGWWDGQRKWPELIALMHSELSEALEEYRAGGRMFYIEGGKPEGIATELVDCIIRILDALAAEGIDIDGVMETKLAYNQTRPHRHGGKQA